MMKKETLSTIDAYKGTRKWCFSIILNRACDHYDDNHNLFAESLLVFEKSNRKDWFDEETRDLIRSQTDIQKRLKDIRNYFSHFHHRDTCLYFKEDDPMRVILERAYAKAEEKIVQRLTEEIDLKMHCLFEASGRITPAGVVFLSSFFVERGILHRLMGDVSGFKKTEGQYKITRKIFSTYCLRDSYSLHTQDLNVVLFRDIMGYLSRVPSEYYSHHKEQCERTQEAERKTDKFITFSLKYLEQFALSELKKYSVSIGRIKVEREQIKKNEDENTKFKPYPDRGQVRIVFDSKQSDLPYYAKHHTAILRIQEKTNNTVYCCKMGVNELKYFVLLCLQGKSENATEAVFHYLRDMQDPTRVLNAGMSNKLYQGLPEFVQKHHGAISEKHDKEKTERLRHVREKWTKKKAESPGAERHRKARDILKHINRHLSRPLSTKEYNDALSHLLKRDFPTFDAQLIELKRTERLSSGKYEVLKGYTKLDVLHQAVCDLVLEELGTLELEPEKLLAFIGLDKTPAGNAPDYDAKLNTFINQPMIYKGFLRERFFSSKQKTFAVLVNDLLHEKRYPDIPLGTEYYHVPSLDRFNKANAVLYETLAQDRLCAMMARRCFENINKNLRKEGQELNWELKDGKEFICLRMRDGQTGDQTSRDFTIRFDRKHYTKLYVMDDAAFLKKLMAYFFPNDAVIDYYKLYSDGIRHYTELQKQGIKAILTLEEIIIREKRLSLKHDYLAFFSKKHNDHIMGKSGYPEDKQATMAKVRNALMHYHLEFSHGEFRTFSGILRQAGIKRKWNLCILEKKRWR